MSLDDHLVGRWIIQPLLPFGRCRMTDRAAAGVNEIGILSERACRERCRLATARAGSRRHSAPPSARYAAAT